MRSGGEIEVVTFSGELDIAGKEQLRGRLSSARSITGILLDLARVSYADSTALTELLRFQIQCRERSIPVAMHVATAQLERIIRYAGLYETFSIFGDREDALRYLEAQP